MKSEKMLLTPDNIVDSQTDNIVTIEIDFKRYECSICGMDEWCGTDRFPMDPQ
jgi:hypothetical protein